MREIIIESNDSGQRADKFLEKAFPALPASLRYRYLRIKRIKRNGKRLSPSDKLLTGDILQLYINDEFFQRDVRFLFLSAPDMVDIVYEDKNILLANKPSGLLVHEDKSKQADTLINRILHYLYNKGEFDPTLENSFTPALCNRIDRNTCGIVISAKNAESLRILNEKIKSHEVKKHYITIIHGVMPAPSGILKGFLIKDSENNTVKVFDSKRPGTREIITGYRVLKTDNHISMLEIELFTGRTHQIRAQFAHIEHPVLGDTKYGTVKQNMPYKVYTQQLCSAKVKFDFSSDAGILNYLNGKSFKVNNIPFENLFFSKNQKS